MLDMRDVEAAITDMGYAQHRLNIETNGANWIDLHREWWRAIWVECAEFLNHYGNWEWWRLSKAPDPHQCKLELVDIWHFGLSLCIDEVSSVERAANDIVSRFPIPDVNYYSQHMPIEWVERVAIEALHRRRFNVNGFFSAWYSLGSDFDEFYKLYNAKLVLNSFRQKYGYREGKYHKNWNGKEDNYWLAVIVSELPESSSPKDDDFKEHLHQELKRCYLAAGYGATVASLQAVP